MRGAIARYYHVGVVFGKLFYYYVEHAAYLNGVWGSKFPDSD